MKLIMAIALGGAVGALGRFGCQALIHQWFGRAFPIGTLCVNVVGSFLMGFLFVWFSQRVNLSEEVRVAVFVGVLGAFTTFSTFSFETVLLLQSGAHLKALANMLLSVVLCVMLCWAGMSFAGFLKT